MDTPPLHTHVPPPAGQWTFVVPVRDASRAKTRLVAPRGVEHAGLVRAMARDVVEAVTAAGAQVVLVTDDPVLALLDDASVRVVPDPAVRGARRGLLAAIEAGLAAIPAESPAAVLLGDVACLRAGDVAELIREATPPGRPHDPATVFVRDAAGTGTTLLAGVRRKLRPRFGAGSAAAHAQDAREIGTRLTRARRDVDTAEDLADAVGLGVGRHTAALLGGLRPEGRPSAEPSEHC